MITLLLDGVLAVDVKIFYFHWYVLDIYVS